MTYTRTIHSISTYLAKIYLACRGGGGEKGKLARGEKVHRAGFFFFFFMCQTFGMHGCRAPPCAVRRREAQLAKWKSILFVFGASSGYSLLPGSFRRSLSHKECKLIWPLCQCHVKIWLFFFLGSVLQRAEPERGVCLDKGHLRGEIKAPLKLAFIETQCK